MKTRDIAMGGIFSAIYIAFSFCANYFPGTARSFIELLCIGTIVIYCKDRKFMSILSFGMANTILLLMLLPINYVVIYGISVILEGILLSKVILLKSLRIQFLIAYTGKIVLEGIKILAIYGVTGVNVFEAYNSRYMEYVNAINDKSDSFQTLFIFISKYMSIIAVTGVIILNMVVTIMSLWYAHFIVKRLLKQKTLVR